MKKLLSIILCALMLIPAVSFTGSYAVDESGHEHDYVWKYPAGSSCADDNRLFINVCTVCGDVKETRTVAASEHSPSGVWVSVVPATTLSEGRDVMYCANCDDVYLVRNTAKLQSLVVFLDVPEGKWFTKAVRYNYALGFFSGVGGGRFAPNDKVTRAMFVTVAAAIAGVDKASYKNSAFSDVPNGKWYTASVTWAASEGIVSGLGNGRFGPASNVTREQSAVILRKLAEYLGVNVSADVTALRGYKDLTSIHSWARDAMAWAVANGLISGKGDGILDPTGTATRAEIAQIVMKFYETVYLPSISLEKDLNYIASDRRLFAEDSILDTRETDASTTLHSPEKQEKVFDFDKSWELNDAVYHNISVAEDGTYRMYYKATSDRRRIAYIESADGLTWTRPELDTYKYNGQKTNVVTDDYSGFDNLYVFRDTNPACETGRVWKGIYGQWGDGLFIEWSKEDDGKYFPNWTDGRYEDILLGQYPGKPWTEAPGTSSPLTGGCYFDTLNTVYWDAARGKYVAFVRGFHSKSGNYQLDYTYVQDNMVNVLRDIRYTESEDFKNWTTPVPLNYIGQDDDQQMYANAITPYYRSNGLYIGIPTRYNIRSVDPENGAIDAYTDNLFMASRDLVNWKRYDSRYMMPFDRVASLEYGDCYPCVGMIETATVDGGKELSLYMKEKASYGEDETVLYRYSLRLDGFVSLDGGEETKTARTTPLSFAGEKLLVNFKTGEEGKVVVRIADEYGNVIESEPLTGDETDGEATFAEGAVASMQSKTVTVTFELTDAELYSFKFE
ncbi:MAG: S-layer homology domain-containing protein [Clostridia bacterium]|nr:S-layer homology domain-containing protein [Clostridia bacterium]